MTSSAVICVDSNVILNLWVEQPLTTHARALWRDWLIQGCHLVAPTLFRYEITSVFRKFVYQKLMTADLGAQGVAEVMRLPIEYVAIPDLHQRAYQLATQFDRPTAYDAHYLVGAQTLGCEFWTADRRLVNAGSHELTWVNWLGSFSSAESPTPESIP